LSRDSARAKSYADPVNRDTCRTPFWWHSAASVLQIPVFVPLFALFAVSASAQPKPDSCHVSVSWWSPQGKLGSGAWELGTFPASEDDPRPVRKSFRDEHTGLFAVVRVEYERETGLRGDPLHWILSLRISASDGEQLSTNDRESEAETFWSRRLHLKVVQEIPVKDLVYRYELSCRGSEFKIESKRKP